MKKLFSISALVILVCFLFTQTQAQVPHMINYQGKLTKPDGSMLPDTSVIVTFTIYNDSTGVTNLWQKQDTVQAKYGVFSVLLGKEIPIPASVFNGQVRYLGVKVGSDVEMKPRKEIVSVGYSFHSEWADTTAFAYTQADSDWTIANPNIYRLTGNVGIGTTSPSYKLDVSGDIRATGTIYGTADNADKVDGYHYSPTWPTSLANIQSACSNDFHNIGGTDDDIPDNDAEVPDNISINNGCLYALSGTGNVGIGTTSPAYDLDVVDDVRVQDDATINDRLIVAPEGSGVPIGPDLYVRDDARIDGNLTVSGTIKLHYDYETTIHIVPNNDVTVTHGLGGNPQKYIVYMVGISSQDHYVHQKNYGTTYTPVGLGYLGCEWGRLTSTTITVWRGSRDGATPPYPYDDWDSTRICILKNQ